MTIYAIGLSSAGAVTFYEGQSVPSGAKEVSQETFFNRLNEARTSAEPNQPLGAVITFKADLYRRCTDDEADAIELALAAAPVRQRRLFESAQYLDHSDPVFVTMHEALIEMFGKERAEVLLAAS